MWVVYVGGRRKKLVNVLNILGPPTAVPVELFEEGEGVHNDSGGGRVGLAEPP